jgi:SpoIID/LytB domain protein
VGVGDYLKGVVPSEMPSSWAPEALKVQAVAARSYAMAGDNRFPGFADTCDTVQCQVYKGIDAEKPSTNAAVDQTAGVVRMANGAIARTEFSASTGGYTAGGTFPAVVDDGDSVSDNPYHDWDVTIPATTIESAYPTIGDFQAIQVTKRNGLGAEGGRVTQAKIIGSAATVTTTGDDVRSKLGLRSDWFAPGTGFARIAAADRYATAAAIATSTFTTTDTAIVARGDGPTSFPDSLAANYLGGTLAVTTLLATSTSVPDVTLTTLQQLGVKNVRLLGGTSALSEGVATALTNAGYSVTRISGADRFVTAAAIATTPDQGGIGTIEGQRTAVLSSGETFPDALAAGGIVYRNHYPQLLTLAGSLPQSTSTALTQLGIKHVLITGGTSAVSDAVEQAVKGLGITTERLAGATRYDTAAAIANASVDRLNFSNTTVDVATGETFPDALTGGSHAGRSQAPILLTAPGSVPQATCAFLTKWKATITVGRVFGGTSAVADSTVSALRACLT